jgi:predicted nuclease of predicted toxin-antitoxin system
VKSKLDENIPELVRAALLELGHDVHTVSDGHLAGADDGDVLRATVVEERVLITLDLDFADLRMYPPGSHRGLWILRPGKQTFRAIGDLVQAGVRLAAVESVDGQLWVIDGRRIRSRDANSPRWIQVWWVDGSASADDGPSTIRCRATIASRSRLSVLVHVGSRLWRPA